MRRRVTLVLSSLLTVVALACGGWLLDPAGSREPAGATAPPRPRPTVPGIALYAQVMARVQAEGTVGYTFSGNSGGGETQSGSGVLRFLSGAEPGRSFDADVMTTSATSGRTRAVLLPGFFYLALPPAKGLPRSKPWLKVSQDPRTELGQDLRPVAEQVRTSFDPAQTLGLLRASGQVVEVGPARVAGRAATLHRASVNLAEAASEAADPALRAQYLAMRRAGVRSLELELWLSPDGLPLRVAADVPGLYSITGVYDGWGDPVRISAPTAKQVFDADSIRG